ncbi:MAG TPA: chitobiase/beta-hexosaminidase C-terminal domain-containing protein, partial [Planctomycetota bacterium]|nr:chitobiase/beta-hexosaminidase C-terminal domain-containing protein [Planctomycetota bacterium]
GRFFSFTAGTGTASNQQEITSQLDPSNRIGHPSSFGEDANGEIYICDHSNGRLHKIVSTITATRVVFTQQPTNTGASAAITPAVRVAVQDEAGNTVTTSSAAVTIALGNNPGSATLGGTTTVTAMNGVATFNSLSLNNAGTGYTVTASSSGLTGATSSAFNILAQVAAPVITPNGGRFSGPVSVQISTATASSTIRYTTDGSAPTNASAIYSGSFQITGTRTIRAFATRSGFVDSAVATATITVSGATPYGLAVRPTAGAYLGMPNASTGTIPGQLSGTGVFSDVAALTPATALIPYAVNSPFWSDAALKTRWVSVPNDGAPYGTGETVTFAATGEWVFPAGTVFVKHFDLVTDERIPNVRRRLETRLLVRAAAGGVYGITYRWNTGQTNADVVTSATTETITITTASGGTRTQDWYYPAPADCLVCHNANAGHVLGLNTRQLNGTLTYGGSGVSDNQVRTWSYLGLFSTSLAESAIGGYAKLSPVTDANASLEQRARSYLDSNCSYCHRPSGAPATFDARYHTPFANQGLINGNVNNTLGISGAKVVVPRDTDRSILYQRIHTVDPTRKMPVLGRNIIDDAGTAMIAQWIGVMDD